jgi:hypothetical protein
MGPRANAVFSFGCEALDEGVASIQVKDGAGPFFAQLLEQGGAALKSTKWKGGAATRLELTSNLSDHR